MALGEPETAHDSSKTNRRRSPHETNGHTKQKKRRAPSHRPALPLVDTTCKILRLRCDGVILPRARNENKHQLAAFFLMNEAAHRHLTIHINPIPNSS
jgi:hypothetical protein